MNGAAAAAPRPPPAPVPSPVARRPSRLPPAAPGGYPRPVALPGSERPSRERENRDWLDALRDRGPAREAAVARLHGLLLKAARFELGRRRAALSHVRGEELDDLAVQAADDALVSVLGKLDDFRGASRFTTWVYKFAIVEAGVKLRRRAWQSREVTLQDGSWEQFADHGRSAQEQLESAEVLERLRAAVESTLTPHQRSVFVALALNGIPIDVIAERTGSSRGALYKTLHDARRKLRAELAAEGLARPPVSTERRS